MGGLDFWGGESEQGGGGGGRGREKVAWVEALSGGGGDGEGRGGALSFPILGGGRRGLGGRGGLALVLEGEGGLDQPIIVCHPGSLQEREKAQIKCKKEESLPFFGS